MGLNEADLHALSRLLGGFGMRVALSEPGGGQPQVLAGPPALLADGPAATLALADGRQLHLQLGQAAAAPAAPAAATPAAAELPMRERRAGPEVADMRFRLLAEHSIDMIVAVDADLAIRYVSPASVRLLGHAPSELQGHTLAELLAHEDRAAFIARHFTRNAQRGQSVPDLFRALHQDGSVRWVEARVARLPAGNGLGDYLVTLRDADQRRHFEESLDKANHELKTLASTDALTGLANRRQFDATLHKEWYRALRDATPLGLLMIDLDRFKALNDRFGHQMGDAFLARVGQVIRDNVRRAGDMAARYGGEEFAVVLPGTAAAGALEIAEHIRRAVAAADTSDLVEGGHRLSVSIGVAATVALAGGGSATLVHSADAALYQAKRNGRNRVEILQ
jgi:diguanylate cyclase (GGDEF)-like protein/PAS domain S-box-containing protein